MAMAASDKQEIIEQYKRGSGDTGSPEVQVALLTARITQLTEMLEARESMTFDELFADGHQRSDVIVTFLAILEMAKLCLIRIAQHVPTGIIRIFYQ